MCSFLFKVEDKCAEMSIKLLPVTVIASSAEDTLALTTARS